MNRNFSQTITVRCDDPAPIVEMLEEWDLNQATSDIMGYMGTRVLADRENPGQYVIIADFGVVDPDVSAADEAARNNERPETQACAARLLANWSTANPSTTTTTSSTAPTSEARRRSRQVGGDEAPHLLGQLAVFRRAEEPTVGHRLEHVELGVDSGAAELAVHAHGVGQEEVTRSGLEERGRERRGEVAEQRRQVRIGEIVVAGVQRDRRRRGSAEHVVDAEVGLERVAGLGEVDLGRQEHEGRRASARPSSRARSMSAAARLPPADPPPTTMRSGA